MLLLPSSVSYSMSHPRIPVDIIESIAQSLHATQQAYTLSQLVLLSKAVYKVASPWLYHDFVMNQRSGTVLDLDYSEFDNKPIADANSSSSSYEFLRSLTTTTRRRLTALAQVRRLTVYSLPPDEVGLHLAEAARRLDSLGTRLFPRVDAVCLLPTAIDELSLWSPVNKADLPPILEVLKRYTSPTYACFAYRLVPASEYAEHRHETRAAYVELPRRIQHLAHDWPVAVVTFHDLVWQKLPSLPTTNVYEFAPPPIPHPLFPGRWLFPTVAQEAQLPILDGPDGDERADQIRGVVRPVIQAAAAATQEEQLELYDNYRWVFCGSERHIQTPLRISHPAIPNDRRHALGYVRGAYRSVLASADRFGEVAPVWQERGVYRPAEACHACGSELFDLFSNFQHMSTLIPGEPDDHPVSTLDSIDPLLTQKFVQGADFTF